jgi:hypothetical protein
VASLIEISLNNPTIDNDINFFHPCILFFNIANVHHDFCSHFVLAKAPWFPSRSQQVGVGPKLYHQLRDIVRPVVCELLPELRLASLCMAFNCHRASKDVGELSKILANSLCYVQVEEDGSGPVFRGPRFEAQGSQNRHVPSIVIHPDISTLLDETGGNLYRSLWWINFVKASFVK